MIKKTRTFLSVLVTIILTHFMCINGGPGDIELSTSYAFPVYNFYIWNKDNSHTKKYSEVQYWKHLEMAYRQNPEAIRLALLESTQRIPKRRVATDQFGRRFVWDHRFGYIPVVTGAYNQPAVKSVPIRWNHGPRGPVTWRQGPSDPVAWHQTPNGPVPFSPYLPGKSDSPSRNIPEWCKTKMAQHMPPVMSSDGPSLDPCNPKQQSEFGMTATSEMTDMLCSFCQVIKHLRCVWQFCSHPEGVYKINLHSDTIFKK